MDFPISLLNFNSVENILGQAMRLIRCSLLTLSSFSKNQYSNLTFEKNRQTHFGSLSHTMVGKVTVVLILLASSKNDWQVYWIFVEYINFTT